MLFHHYVKIAQDSVHKKETSSNELILLTLSTFQIRLSTESLYFCQLCILLIVL